VPGLFLCLYKRFPASRCCGIFCVNNQRVNAVVEPLLASGIFQEYVVNIASNKDPDLPLDWFNMRRTHSENQGFSLLWEFELWETWNYCDKKDKAPGTIKETTSPFVSCRNCMLRARFLEMQEQSQLKINCPIREREFQFQASCAAISGQHVINLSALIDTTKLGPERSEDGVPEISRG